MVALSCLGAMTPCRIAELCIGAAIVVACGVLIGVVSAARPYAVIALVVTLVYVFRLWRVLPYERRRATVATAVYARYLLEQSHVPDMTSAREAKAEAAKATTAATDTSPTLLSAGAAPLSRLNTPAARAEREPTYGERSVLERDPATTAVRVQTDMMRRSPTPNRSLQAPIRVLARRGPHNLSGAGGLVVGSICTKGEIHVPYGAETHRTVLDMAATRYVRQPATPLSEANLTALCGGGAEYVYSPLRTGTTQLPPMDAQMSSSVQRLAKHVVQNGGSRGPSTMPRSVSRSASPMG